ncbi:arginase family protein [Pseudonocardia humida]|uniref:Arginase family protein n=1 Tax=Pseudonocardia humida TaxID=2800819 RepID=A0ABT1A8A7_9PSEU|nr:arginase family protein [Pseudonocardia humida]MCO1659260.1 arginase family protein [Pseudonocardia humida]
MPRPIGLLGVPSSAGAKTPGIEKAVPALRAAGLVPRLAAAGLDVVDHGDLPTERWRPDPANPRGQNPGRVAAVAAALRERLAPVLAAGHVPLVVGGDCTVTVGAVAACDPATTLVYVDGGVDTYTPATNDEGNLDSMGVAHLLDVEGATALAGIGPRRPLLPPEQVVFFGVDPARTDDVEMDVPRRHAITLTPADEVHGRPAAAAADTLAALAAPHRSFLVHLDVDVIDFLDLPVADVPSVGFGLSAADTFAALGVFCADPGFAGLVVTEVNPDHADAADLDRLLDGLVGALAGTR